MPIYIILSNMQHSMAAKMFWTAGLVLVALTLGQVPVGLAKPEAIIADAEASSASERIVSGWVASPGQFPYVAHLRAFASVPAALDCVGSVVHRNWVLTSASCPHNRHYVQVRVGVIFTSPVYNSNSREWWSHPNYRNNDIYHNIAILKLELSITFSNLVQPIRIQPWTDAFKDYDNEVVIASGWGRLTLTDFTTPRNLRWVYLRAISNQECSGDQYRFTENFICTRGYNVTTQATCHGDNGGPLAHIGRDGQPVLVGIATLISGHSCGTSGNPAAFTRPGPYLSWLTNVTGINFDEGPEPTTTEATVLPTSEATEPPTTEAPDYPTTEATDPPTTEASVSLSTEAPKPPTTDTPEPPTTEAPKPPTTVLPKPPTTEALEPPITELPEPPTTDFTEPPTTEAPEPPTTEAPKPPTTELPKPPTTEAPEPPITELPEPPTTEFTEPPTTEAPEPPTTEAPEPPSTELPELPSTEVPEPSTTEAPESDSDENDENSNDLDGSESKEESEFGNKQVKVKVKVKVNNSVKIK